jgi:hypothetical protein
VVPRTNVRPRVPERPADRRGVLAGAGRGVHRQGGPGVRRGALARCGARGSRPGGRPGADHRPGRHVDRPRCLGAGGRPAVRRGRDQGVPLYGLAEADR